MKRNVILILITILAFTAIPAQAQFGKIKEAVDRSKKAVNAEEKQNSKSADDKKLEKHNMYNEKDPTMLFIGKDNLDGAPIANFEVCAESYGLNTFQLKKSFKKWITDISPTAMEKSYAHGTCNLMGFVLDDASETEEKKEIAGLETLAQGDSVYKIAGDKLMLVKNYVIPENFIVVVPAVNKSGLALADLNLGVTPALKDTYRRKTKGVYNYHDLKQALYLFEKYKKYPSANATNAVLFSGEDFEKLNTQGKFKGLIIYKLVGEKLVPVE
jgi:hypothetical protein